MKLYSKVMGKGQPLIVMHGVFGSGDNWSSLGRKWSDNYEIHLLDMRNHGKSPHSEEFSYDIMAEDLLEYLDDRHISGAIILGHSMGGKVAMLFAALHPEKVEKLIVADISPRSYKPHHQEIIIALENLPLDKISSRQEAEDEFEKLLDNAGVRQFLLKSLYWEDKEKLNWRFNVKVIKREVNKIGDALPANAIYYGSTLFLRGGNSPYIQEKDEELIHTHFPEAKIKTIDGAGHWLHAEKPREFDEIFMDFIGS